MKIYTLTLSPAYDVHAECGDFAQGKENLVTVISRETGGKGINISRALKGVDIETVPVVLLGEVGQNEFKSSLEGDGLSPVIISTQGRIRENLTIHHTGGETRISYKGAKAPSELSALLGGCISPAPCDILTVTGRLPEGICPKDLYPYLSELSQNGVKLIIDSRSYTKEDISSLHPWLIKPNREEIAEYLGATIESLSDAVRYKEALISLGAEYVLLTLDSEGAALISKNDILTLHAPKVNAVSTIGAGDAAIAGFIYAHLKRTEPLDALRYSIAFGSAATLSAGTRPPSAEDVKTLLNNML